MRPEAGPAQLVELIKRDPKRKPRVAKIWTRLSMWSESPDEAQDRRMLPGRRHAVNRSPYVVVGVPSLPLLN